MTIQCRKQGTEKWNPYSASFDRIIAVFDVFIEVPRTSGQVINRALVISRDRGRVSLRENHEWLINSKSINKVSNLDLAWDSPGVSAPVQAGLTYRINASWYRTIIYCVIQFELRALLYDLMSSSRDDATRVWFVPARCVCSSPAATTFTRCLYTCVAKLTNVVIDLRDIEFGAGRGRNFSRWWRLLARRLIFGDNNFWE